MFSCEVIKKTFFTEHLRRLLLEIFTKYLPVDGWGDLQPITSHFSLMTIVFELLLDTVTLYTIFFVWNKSQGGRQLFA